MEILTLAQASKLIEFTPYFSPQLPSTKLRKAYKLSALSITKKCCTYQQPRSSWIFIFQASNRSEFPLQSQRYVQSRALAAPSVLIMQRCGLTCWS